MPTIIRNALKTILAGALLGFLVLGVGGRLGMHVVALIVTGQGAFTLGGTFSVLVVGTGFGAAAGLVLSVARATLLRWPPMPSILYWGAAALYLLPRLDWAERAEPLLLLPLGLAFGALLQAATWRWRRVSNA